MSDMTCPSCVGQKTNRVLANFGAEGCREVDMPCTQCGGVGKVPSEMTDWIKAGEKMRRDRLSRHIGQREEAQRRGMDVVTYSRMEWGKIEPTWGICYVSQAA